VNSIIHVPCHIGIKIWITSLFFRGLHTYQALATNANMTINQYGFEGKKDKEALFQSQKSNWLAKIKKLLCSLL
jgi:hypothetical protein